MRIATNVRLAYGVTRSMGLEADEVYIVDANDGVIPNKGQLAKLEKSSCFVDIAREVRNERSLVYVACTRAKELLTIYHTEDKLSSLFTTYNEFTRFDEVYKNYKDEYSDAEVFQEFINVHRED